MTKHLTKEQQKLLETLVLDADLLGLSDRDGITYIDQKIGKKISLSTYSRTKKRIFSDNEIKLYYKNYARTGLLQLFKERLNEMKLIHHETLKLWFKEIRKDEQYQDKKLILHFVDVLRANSQHLMNLAVSLPPMAEINNILDERQEIIRQLNEKIQNIYRKHVGFIMKKEMEFNLNKFKIKGGNNNEINLLSDEKKYNDKEDEKNGHNNNSLPNWISNLTKEFIDECIENEIDNNNNDNNSNTNATRLSNELREQLKKHMEVYEQIKKVQEDFVFEDL